MIIRAGALLTMDGPPIPGGEVSVSGNRISAVGPPGSMVPLASETVLDLADHIVMPGLINAHCHLDYTMMRNAIAPPASFSAWVQRINAIKRSLDSDDYLTAIERGFAELKRWGTTTVCNIEAFPELMPRMAAPPIRTWWFYEMIDIRHRITTDEVVAGALMFFQRRDETAGGFGLSPHAPYTASTMLYHLANDCAATMDMPLMTHVAESREELEMFRDARGPLYEFMASLRRPMDDCGGTTPFARLWGSRAIDSTWLLTHMNELSEEDFVLLSSLPPGSTPHIVHCPGSHRYFGHSRFPYRRLHTLGVNICVGTDSLASNDSLSLLAELRRLQRNEPWLEPLQLVRTVTVNAARALRRENQLGRILPGALADLIAIPFSGRMETVHEEVVSFAEPIPWMMIDGKLRL